MKRPWYVPTALFAAILMVAMSLAVGGRSITAQDATPETGGMEEPEAHPAHIHLGTCDSLGEVVFPLNDVVHESVGGDPAATPSTHDMGDMASPAASDMGDMAAMASPTAGGDVVASSTTEGIAAALTDIVAGGHAVNVHLSAEEIGTYIACGEIEGDAASGELTIELQELNDSGYMGTATLTDNGDGTTTVVVELMRTDAGMATPTA